MRIAIFDYLTTPNNPTGRCNLALLAGLCEEHDFTVFSPWFVNPRPERIRWVRVRVPKRPLALLFVSFHVMALLSLLWRRLRGAPPFDLIQVAESNLLIGDLSYVHFCHRAFLREHWREVSSPGVRNFFRWLDHWLHAVLEPVIFRRIGRVVAPSRGLANELIRYYPELAGKVQVVPNPIDVDRLNPPAKLDREKLRASLGLEPPEITLIFCALGHFERKGLGVLLDALENLTRFPWRLVVVGGLTNAIRPYRNRGCGRVTYVGMQQDVRPFLWAGDAFILPSAYETFSLVTFEAAASGLPLLVSRLHGVEDLLRDGQNGMLLGRDRKALEAALMRFFRSPSEARRQMGAQARYDVAPYNPTAFVDRWRQIYHGRQPFQRSQAMPGPVVRIEIRKLADKALPNVSGDRL
jgi:glycosyltransferase involved in cell wall biosynthesis